MPITKNQSNKLGKNPSGSLENSEPEFLEVGRIGRTHGLRGEVWMDLYTDFPERLVPGKVLFFGKDFKPITIRSFRISGVRGLAYFDGINSLDEADLVKNQIVYVKTEHMPRLPEGEYYHHDLIGMKVVDEQHHEIGCVAQILQTGSNDVYVVISAEDEKKEVLIPAIKSVIIKVDIETKTIIVKLQEWI